MDLLYSNKDFAVCIKPVGLDSETQLPLVLKQMLGGEIFTVHRLDKNVGGVMIFARTKPAAAALTTLIQNGEIEKEYVAQVHGIPPETGDWTDYLFKDTKNKKVFVVKRIRAGVKSARLEFTRLSQGEVSLVRVLLHSGRTHQIRVQFASRGFPLVGDHKYGARDGEDAPMLFSCCIRFPWKGKNLCFEQLPDWA